MTNEKYYICVAVRKITDTDDVGKSTEYFEQRCEDKDTASGLFDILKRAVLRSSGDESKPVSLQ